MENATTGFDTIAHTRNVSHPLSIAGEIVPTFLSTPLGIVPGGPSPSPLDSTKVSIYVADLVSGRGRPEWTAERQFGGAFAGGVFEQPELHIGEFTTVGPMAAPTGVITFVDVPASGNVPQGTSAYVYTYVLSTGVEILPYSVLSTHAPTGSGNAVECTMLSRGPIAGGDTVIATRLYRDDFTGEDPFYFVGEVASNGGTITDTFSRAEIVLRGEASTDNLFYVPWRTQLIFDLSGGYGFVSAGSFHCSQYVGRSLGLGTFDMFAARGRPESSSGAGDALGFGDRMTIDDWDRWPGTDFVFAGSYTNRLSSLYIPFNQAGLDKINETIDAGEELHLGIKHESERLQNGIEDIELEADAGSQGPNLKPQLVLEMADATQFIGFPHLHNRSITQLVSP